MPIDLHTHSTASDGTESPTRVVEMAAAHRLTALALTDHDTLQGVPEARAAASEHGIELVPGTELSVEYARGGMHLVVLWLEPGPGPLQDRLEALQGGRDHRNRLIVSRLAELGLPLTYEEVEAEAGGGSVGRPHIASVMVGKGYVPSIADAFELWLAAGRPAYVGRLRLTPEEAIRLARQSGGVPILAHPHTLGIDRAEEMAALLTRLVDAGLVGMEAHYAGYHRHEREGYAHLARRFGLIPSGGSDYHGDYKPGLEVGVGFGDLEVADTVLEELRTRVTAA